MPGLLSALGMLCATPLYTFSHAVMLQVQAESQQGLAELPQVLQAVARLAEQAVAALTGDGVPPDERRLEFSLDLRYAGQSHELTVPLSGGMAAAFAVKHHELYGYEAPGRALEIVTARVAAQGTPRDLLLPELARRTGRDTLEDAIAHSRIYEEGHWVNAWRIDRSLLRAGDRRSGPGVICEYSATTLVPSGWRCTVNPYGQLLLELKSGAGP
jgi:N-methylhydantoinase A